MTDQFDRAEELEQKQRDIAMAYRKPTLKSCGLCHSCGEDVAGTRQFCDADCRDDYERIEAAKLRNGGFHG